MKFSILNKIFKGKNRKVGVALGGGAVRGLAHIGVLRVLEENDIPIDCISGVSSGSIVGCIYASGRSACELIEIMKESGWSDIGQVTVSKKGLFSSQKIEDFVKKYSKTNDFSKTKIPFAVSSVDLITGEEVIIKKGELSKAVRASVSFPGIYIPFEYNNKVLVDGSIENILPVKALLGMGADFIIGVDVIPNKVILKKIPENSFYIIDRCLDLMFEKIPKESKYKNVDIVIQPNKNENITSIDLFNKDKLVLLGRRAAEEKLSLIKNKLKL